VQNHRRKQCVSMDAWQVTWRVLASKKSPNLHIPIACAHLVIDAAPAAVWQHPPGTANEGVHLGQVCQGRQVERVCMVG
jgi:hypothetical protein